MSANIEHYAATIRPKPRYAATGALCLGWPGDGGSQSVGARRRIGDMQPAFLPVQLNNRIPSHVTGALSP
ncbi:MAG TPA: hypothetical protein PKM78_05095 [Anaerolineae bacterium]|nr:hypothetical protein [Anaerolineae bacterium]HNU02852.1 hypothetical protein [Anaerolineae bacterium]